MTEPDPEREAIDAAARAALIDAFAAYVANLSGRDGAAATKFRRQLAIVRRAHADALQALQEGPGAPG